MSIMRLIARNPTKYRKDAREDVDPEDRTDELPGGPSACPASDEDEPVLERVGLKGVSKWALAERECAICLPL